MESVLPLLLKNTFGSMKNNWLYPLSLKGGKSGLKCTSRKELQKNIVLIPQLNAKQLRTLAKSVSILVIYYFHMHFSLFSNLLLQTLLHALSGKYITIQTLWILFIWQVVGKLKQTKKTWKTLKRMTSVCHQNGTYPFCLQTHTHSKNLSPKSFSITFKVWLNPIALSTKLPEI